jgi:hypothetical protein
VSSVESLRAEPQTRVPGPWGHAIVAWGVFGVLALIAQAMWRLTPLALEPIRANMLTPAQATLYGVWVVLNAYAEGYRGFHKRFSPRVVSRALHLAREPRALHVLLAPAFCMSLFHATTRGKRVAWGVTLGVIALVMLVRAAPQPWRGIIDGGVVVGLFLGGISIVYHLVLAFSGRMLEVEIDLPEA